MRQHALGGHGCHRAGDPGRVPHQNEGGPYDVSAKPDYLGAVLSIRMLGPLEIDRDGVPIVVRGRMTQALLVRLALDTGAVVSTDGLVDALWGDDPPAGATNALQVKVSELRRAIGAAQIVARRPGYVLDVAPDSVDALVAEALIAEARAEADADPESAAARYGRALALWRGPAMSSVTDAPFASSAAARWQELRLAAFEERSRLELAAGRTRPLIAELEATIAENPLREPLVEVLMSALAAEGRQVAALGAYRELRARLVADLGIDPSPRLQEIERRVLQQDPTVVLAARPARVAPAPLPPTPGPTVRLPHPVSSFVQRRDDLTSVEQLLGTRRLVTITGPGGVGKTRLAVEVARRIATPTDGVWFVPLEAVVDVDGIPDALATALGVVGADTSSAIRERLRSAELLLVLDNCEHLGDELAVLIDELLQSAPGLRCLATSQRPIGIPGEARWPLGPLPRAKAVELFVERARDVSPHGAYDDVELIGGLCAQLDDLPLAIELAAGRCGVLSVQEIADRLHDRFSLLSDGRRGRSPRQQTLDATISWSYDLLFPDGQLALQAVAAFTGGASFAGIEAILTRIDVPPGEVFDLVTQLVDRSLVVPDHSTSSVRYGVLEGVRAFAGAQAVREGRAPLIGRAHAAWVSELARTARSGLRGTDQRSWLAAVRAERSNIDAALGWMAANEPLAALDVVADLYLAWMMLGDSEAGAARALRAVADAGAGDDAGASAPDLALGRAEACAAQLLARTGATDRAVSLAERAAARVGDGPSADHAEVTSIVGRVLLHAGRYEEGCRLVADAGTRFVELGDHWGEAMAQLSIGWAEHLNGHEDRAERACRAALDALSPATDGWVTHAAHRLLGVLAAEAGDYPRAFAEYGSALAAARAMGSTTDEGQVLARIAATQAQAGDRAAAAETYRVAWQLSRLAGDQVSVESARRAMSDLAADRSPTVDVAAPELVDRD